MISLDSRINDRNIAVHALIGAIDLCRRREVCVDTTHSRGERLCKGFDNPIGLYESDIAVLFESLELPQSAAGGKPPNDVLIAVFDDEAVAPCHRVGIDSFLQEHDVTSRHLSPIMGSCEDGKRPYGEKEYSQKNRNYKRTNVKF